MAAGFSCTPAWGTARSPCTSAWRPRVRMVILAPRPPPVWFPSLKQVQHRGAQLRAAVQQLSLRRAFAWHSPPPKGTGSSSSVIPNPRSTMRHSKCIMYVRLHSFKRLRTWRQLIFNEGKYFLHQKRAGFHADTETQQTSTFAPKRCKQYERGVCA